MIAFEIVVAMDLNRGIGKGNQLPWHLIGDMKHFKKLTSKTNQQSKKNVLIMGRRTWESLPEGFRPLPRRVNIILTRNRTLTFPEGVLSSGSLNEVMTILRTEEVRDTVEKVFVIGGAQVYKEALKHPACHKIHLTQIFHQFDCDTFFPEYKNHFQKISESPTQIEDSVEYCFCEYIPIKESF